MLSRLESFLPHVFVGPTTIFGLGEGISFSFSSSAIWANFAILSAIILSVFWFAK